MVFIHCSHTYVNVYMQLTAFDDFKKWPFTDVDVPDWFYVGVAKTGLPAIIVVCAGGYWMLGWS